jgi:hypothetical protein
VPLTWLLPFNIADTYDPATSSQGAISYQGFWVIIPFGGKVGTGYENSWQVGNVSSIWFEVVPGTMLRASVSGRVRVLRNPVRVTPDGQTYDPQDWEVHLQIGNGPYWVEYDHMVELLVSDGEMVGAGQLLGRASPAAIRHGGIEGEKPVEEFKWVLKLGGPTPTAICPLGFLMEAEQAKLLSVLERMGSLGLPTGPSACLVEQRDG